MCVTSQGLDTGKQTIINLFTLESVESRVFPPQDTFWTFLASCKITPIVTRNCPYCHMRKRQGKAVKNKIDMLKILAGKQKLVPPTSPDTKICVVKDSWVLGIVQVTSEHAL